MESQAQVGETQAFQRGLYESVKKSVWVLEIEGKYVSTEIEDLQSGKVTLTAFAVQVGYLMTCAHDWADWFELTIRATPFCVSPGVWYDASVFVMKRQLDMCILQLVNCPKTTFVVPTLGLGNLEVGDPLLTIGHPDNFIGSGTFGSVAYPCTQTAASGFHCNRTCATYVCDALSRTPPYRIMGHVWNRGLFKRLRRDAFDYIFQMDLLSDIPIIQCACLIGGDSACGGPVFNSNGELVGMLIGQTIGYHSYQISVHIVAIRALLNEYENSMKAVKSKGSEATKSQKRKHST